MLSTSGNVLCIAFSRAIMVLILATYWQLTPLVDRFDINLKVLVNFIRFQLQDQRETETYSCAGAIQRT
jgi:hypothetical protein